MYNGTPFKTPLPYRTPRGGLENGRMHSDSEESVCSSNSDNAETASTPSTNNGNGEISLVAEYDDLIRSHRKLRTDKVQTETTLLDVMEQVKVLYSDYFQAVDECKRLQNILDNKIHECSDLEHKLQKARKLIDQEKTQTRRVIRERDDLAMQINQIRDLIFRDKATSSRFSEEMKNKLSFLHNNNSDNEWNYNNAQLSAIKEINSTGSILSNFSYSRSEDDLNESLPSWRKHRPSTGGVAEPSPKRRRSSGNRAVEIGASDTVRATTTLTLTKDGPITATSVIESVPKAPAPPESVESYPGAPPANLVFESWARESPRKREQITRQHSFQQKTVVMPDTCGPCEKRIRFGKVALKCKECKAICHVECKDNLPLPCIPVMNTPTQRNVSGVIGDYTPTTPPMVPALLIHCINEIELRGLNEVGLYRVPGPERDVKSLKEKFLKGRGAPCLNKIDIHVLCGTVKDFLRGLNESITTYALWKDFTQAVEARDPIDVLPSLCQIISMLPQPNRDTLAYIILHLQKVSQSKECKMGVANLAKVFGPTIIGYSSENVDAAELLSETVKTTIVMEHLINIPSDYWSSFINVETTLPPCRLQQTPSTDSLLRPTVTRGIFATPNRNLSLIKRKQKYFASPQQ